MRDQGDCRANETNERSGLGNVLAGKIGKGRSSFPCLFFDAIVFTLEAAALLGHSAAVLDFSW
jgi:hypothetical protein